MDLSVYLYLALLAAVGLLRLVELRISWRHQQRLLASGAVRVPEPHFRWMVAVHTAVLIGAAVEVVVFRRPFLPLLAGMMFTLFIAGNLLRLWVVLTLGDLWSMQVMDSTSVGVVTTGPFRYVRHPNYLGVIMEMVSLPLIHTAWITALAIAPVYAWALTKRLQAEEPVLMASSEYRAAMGFKPRFLPRLF